MPANVRGSLTIVDDWGVEASTFIYAALSDDASVANIVAAMSALATTVDAVTGGRITGSRVTVFPALPGGLKTGAVTGDHIGMEGLFDFYATGTTKRWAFGVPALANATGVVSGGKIVLTTGSPAQALVNLLLTTATTGLTHYQNATNQQLTSFSLSRIATRKHRKQTQSKTESVAP